MQAQKAEGTKDLIGREMRAWQRMQRVAAEVFGPYGFEPVETPAIEQVDVFVHGIGQSTDVVRKEMFRVFSGANLERALAEGTDAKLKAKQRLALRPEGTAGVVRSVVENNLVPQGASPVKLYYAEAMFRGERPQKGRLRQFHQVGIEWLGAPDPAADAECIIMLMEFYQRLGFDLSKLRLLINSMGDPACRPAYRDKVRQFILDHADDMCDECRERAELNPLRAFDCKNDHCREIMKDAPLMRDELCDECRVHYEQVKRYLDAGATTGSWSSRGASRPRALASRWASSGPCSHSRRSAWSLATSSSPACTWRTPATSFAVRCSASPMSCARRACEPRRIIRAAPSRASSSRPISSACASLRWWVAMSLPRASCACATWQRMTKRSSRAMSSLKRFARACSP